MLREGFRGPGAESVNNRVKALQVLSGELHNVLDDGLLGGSPVLRADKNGHVVSAFQCFLNDELSGFSVCCDDCD